MQALNEIAKMNNEELNAVIDAIKRRRKVLESQTTASLNVGDRVTFTGKRGEQIVGKVDKVNRKTVIVNEENSFKQWKVSASLLEKC